MQVECCGTCKYLIIDKYRDGNLINIEFNCAKLSDSVEIFDKVCSDYEEYKDAHEYIIEKF